MGTGWFSVFSNGGSHLLRSTDFDGQWTSYWVNSARGGERPLNYSTVHRSDPRWSLEELSSAKEPQNEEIFGGISILGQNADFGSKIQKNRREDDFANPLLFRVLPPKSRSDRIFDFGLFLLPSSRYSPGIQLVRSVIPLCSFDLCTIPCAPPLS